MSEKTTYEAIDGRIAPESLTADTSAGLEVVTVMPSKRRETMKIRISYMKC